MISDAPQTRPLSRLEHFCRDLCLADWDDPNGPMTLSRDLSGSDFSQAVYYQNARQFLLVLRQNQGTPATATGNLTRAFVSHMFPRMTIPPLRRETILRVNKVSNETDLWELHLVRVVSECAGLVKRRGKHFRLTRKGAGLLDESCAGELYRTLFVAFFRSFNLNYHFNLRDVPAIQQSFAVTLWRLQETAQKWVPVKGLAPLVLLPRVLEQLRQAMRSEYDREEWILSGYVLDHLLDFGLIERKRDQKDEWPGVTEKDSIRLTTLWPKFISFKPFVF